MAGSCSATTRSGVAVGSGAFLPGMEEKNPFFFFPGEKGQKRVAAKAAAPGRLPLEVSQLSSWRHPWIFYFHL